MTTFTTEDRKAATKKPKKEKVVITPAPEVAEQAVVQEIVTARTEAVVKEIQTSKAAIIAKTLEEEIEEAREWVDVPEPGVVDVAVSPNEADVTRRGFTTMHMAQVARNNTNDPSNHLIVELRDVQGTVLAYYITHKRDEL